ncbi:general secretion pathway protein GspB [uncultured Vibrio sp.]|uniref:general secretion pathway protein GspB n=1 Tax=uncultured Vibrio sp. TaxID=114054 RepID=UPI000919B406|nr:general secretion pathway protein GspB [uncultured Vibrio sp.]OIQ23381.1 MAG: hypothetical protein BM561_11215 [Vibrio sp. MedPE-SWchi]
MSEILKALKHSELQHQSRNVYSSSETEVGSSSVALHSKGIIAAAFLAPVMLTSIWISIDTYRFYQEQDQRQENEAPRVAEVVEIESRFTSLPYLPVKPLRTTQLSTIERAIDMVLPTAIDESPEEFVAVVNNDIVDGESLRDEEDVDALSQLDLTQFSPELAQRVQSAFYSNTQEGDSLSQSEKKAQYNSLDAKVEMESIKLAQKGADFIGRLPALNFQTHVYSSQESKRWVKVNNSEFTEGDWITPDLQLIEIRQRYSTINFQGQRIEVPALYDWKG